MLSNPAALPLFRVLSALFSSALVIGPGLIASGGAPVWLIGGGLFRTSLKVFPPTGELVLDVSQDCPTLAFNWFALNAFLPAEHLCCIINFLDVILLCCLLGFPSNGVDSFPFIFSATPLDFAVLLFVVIRCGLLLGKIRYDRKKWMSEGTWKLVEERRELKGKIAPRQVAIALKGSQNFRKTAVRKKSKKPKITGKRNAL